MAVEERHAVVERGRVGVLERLGPRLAAVLRDVDPRGLAGPDREQDDVVGAERLDVAEPLACRVGRSDVLPGGAAVERAQHGAAAAAHPGGVRVHGGEAAEAGGRARRTELPGEARARAGCGARARQRGREGCAERDGDRESENDDAICLRRGSHARDPNASRALANQPYSVSVSPAAGTRSSTPEGRSGRNASGVPVRIGRTCRSARRRRAPRRPAPPPPQPPPGPS